MFGNRLSLLVKIAFWVILMFHSNPSHTHNPVSEKIMNWVGQKALLKLDNGEIIMTKNFRDKGHPAASTHTEPPILYLIILVLFFANAIMLISLHNSKEVTTNSLEASPHRNSQEEMEVSDKTHCETNNLNEQQIRWLQASRDIIEGSLENKIISISELAAKNNLSLRQYNRRLNKLTGLSASRFVREVQLEAAYNLLHNGLVSSVSEAAYRCGFEYPSTFSRLFKKKYGVSPNSIRH